MNYCSYDRFQGAWLGGMIGAALGGKQDKSDYAKIIEYKGHDWVDIVDKIAHNIVGTQNIETYYIKQQLAKPSFELKSDKPYKMAESEGLVEQIQCDRNISIHTYSNLWLSLLPSIALAENNESTYSKIVVHSNFNLKSADEIQVETNISIWTHLLTLALKNQFETNSNVSMMVKQVLGGVEQKTALLIEKLSIVEEALEYGSSLQELSQKLCRVDDRNISFSGAIALSFYCFASTPRNFMLSVKRASHLREPLSVSITALTATISGAYNGVARIPGKWLDAANANQFCQQAQKTIEQLYKNWLGTLDPSNNKLSYDPETDVVAFPQLIQPRSSLKIISQIV